MIVFKKKYFIDIIYFLIFLFTGILIYFQSLSNAFVWDDRDQIVNTHSGDALGNIIKFFFGFHYGRNNLGMPNNAYEAYYRPLHYTVLSALYGLFGGNVFFYHFFQILLHCANAFLIALFLKKFFPRHLSFILAILFLIHPINSEAVLYISALQESLFFFFGMCALILFDAKQNNLNLLFGGIFLLSSIFSKETGFLFFFIIALYFFLLNRLYLKKIILVEILVAFFYVVMRFFIAGVFLARLNYVPIINVSLAIRLFTMPAVFFYYIKTFFFPKNLSISQHWIVTSQNMSLFYFPLIIDVLIFLIIISFGIYLFKKKKNIYNTYLFFTLWFLTGMALHMQIFPLDMTVAERWFYFPFAGLLGIIAVIIKTFLSARYTKRSIFLSIVLLSFLAFRSFQRSFDWKTPLTLYLKDSQINKSSFDLESNLGAELFRAGKKDEAKEHFEKSISLAPNHWVNSANLAGYYFSKKDFTNAEKYYLISINNNPYFVASRENYSRLLLSNNSDQGKKAKQFLEKSVQIFPKNSKLWLYLSVANYEQGLKDEALNAAKRSVQLAKNPENIYVYTQLMKNLPLDIK